MKKYIVAFLLATALLTVPSMAYSANQQNTADALNSLGLFLGTGTERGYDLDAKLNRNQGVILLVRMLGKEQEAQSGKYQHPFKDVPAGASGYVGYAYSQGIVNGYSKERFGGSDPMTDTMFMALSLRALGYTDSGDAPDFKYRESRKMAQSLGLVKDAANDSDFTRGDTVEVFWKILQTSIKGKDKTLGDRLVEQEVITKTQMTKAADIQKNGKKTSASSGSNGWSATSGGSNSSGSSGSSGGASESGGSGDAGTTVPDTEKKPNEYTWEEYQNMTSQEQKEFRDCFDSLKDFFDWKKVAQAAYDEANPKIEIGSDSTIDAGELINGGRQ